MQGREPFSLHSRERNFFDCEPFFSRTRCQYTESVQKVGLHPLSLSAESTHCWPRHTCGPSQILGRCCLLLRQLYHISLISVQHCTLVCVHTRARLAAALGHGSMILVRTLLGDPCGDSYLQMGRMQSVVPDSLGISVSLAGQN